MEVFIIHTRRKKQRGQKRKLRTLLKHIDEFEAFQNADELFEHFHVPCAYGFINSQKTSSKVKTAFCKKWIETTERFIKQKPSKFLFCKIVSFISVSSFWDSQIIVFYDEAYYNTFWDRKTPKQFWAQIPDKNLSFARERGIQTSLKEIGYIETMKEDNYIHRDVLWYYGEL